MQLYLFNIWSLFLSTLSSLFHQSQRMLQQYRQVSLLNFKTNQGRCSRNIKCCTEGRGLVGNTGRRWMFESGDLAGLSQPWWFYYSESELEWRKPIENNHGCYWERDKIDSVVIFSSWVERSFSSHSWGLAETSPQTYLIWREADFKNHWLMKDCLSNVFPSLKYMKHLQ